MIILVAFMIGGCRSGLIDCPDARGPKSRQTIINTKTLKPEDLYVSSLTSKDIHQGRSLSKLKEQKQVHKDPATIEEWDCPRPGEQKNNKMVKANLRKMEKMNAEMKKRMALDSLNAIGSKTVIQRP